MFNDFSALLRLIARLLASDPSPDGHICTRTLHQLADASPTPALCPTHPFTGKLDLTLNQGAHPGILPFRKLLPRLDWHHAGLENGSIRADISTRMLTVELVGPDGMLFHPGLRAGLFWQGPHLDYATRRHAAEETFVILAGRANWSTHDGALSPQDAGALIHHRSMTPHRTVTRRHSTLAAWRWSGDVGWEGYEMTG